MSSPKSRPRTAVADDSLRTTLTPRITIEFFAAANVLLRRKWIY